MENNNNKQKRGRKSKTIQIKKIENSTNKNTNNIINEKNKQNIKITNKLINKKKNFKNYWS